MYSKKQPISSLREGDRVEDIFVVKIKRSLMSYKNKPGVYFSLVLSDSSGRSIEYKYWGSEEARTREVYDSLREDSVVLVQGRVESYEGKLQISSNPPEAVRALPEGEYNPQEFIMPAKRDLDEMVRELDGHVQGIGNPEIKAIVNRVFREQGLLKRFRVHPGSIEIHHNWTGGLLQHTLEVVRYCRLSQEMFQGLDKDLMTAGAILHDIGKLEEIKATTRIKGTRKGKLSGHIAIGFRLVSRVMDELKTGEDVRDKLLHIILSHHGWMEYGSPKEPMLSEALAVYYADELSAKLAEITEFISNARDDTKDEFMYHRRQGKNIFLR
jgi:3'-5' exoribonuclease